MTRSNICKIKIGPFWLTVPAEITILQRKETGTFHVNGWIDCEIHLQEEWAELIRFNESLREKEG